MNALRLLCVECMQRVMLLVLSIYLLGNVCLVLTTMYLGMVFRLLAFQMHDSAYIEYRVAGALAQAT